MTPNEVGGIITNISGPWERRISDEMQKGIFFGSLWKNFDARRGFARSRLRSSVGEGRNGSCRPMLSPFGSAGKQRHGHDLRRA